MFFAPPEPPGSRSSTPPTCLDLIRGGGIGRVVFDDDHGPLALPVNFRTLHDSIVFRTGHGALAEAMASGHPLSIEVDHLDEALGEGWSVVLRGHGMLVTGATALREVHELAIESWAGAERASAVRLVADEVTGRRIRRHL